MTHETPTQNAVTRHAGTRARGFMIRAVATVACASPLAALAQTAPVPANGGFADRVKAGVTAAGGPAGLTNTPPLETLIGNIINTVLGFVGVILFGYILYAGFLWMTAGGDKTKIQTATAMIRNAIIGLIIIVAAFAITTFVLSRLGAAQTGTTVG
jgi:hypothetical protein